MLPRRQLLLSAAALAPLGATAPAFAAVAAPAPTWSPLIIASPRDEIGFERAVTEFTLSNGLHFIVLRRAAAPVVSCHTLADVGAFDEDPGQTGLAHLLEHMAFKGTQRIGTRDYVAEAPLLAAADEAFYALREAQANGSGMAVAMAAGSSMLVATEKQIAQIFFSWTSG